MMNDKYMEMRKEAINDIIDSLDWFSGYYCDLHNEVFNTDYYIVGTYQAKEALKEFDVFEAIEKVMDYEKDTFGEVYTEISDPEKLVNMLYYVIGDEIIGEMCSSVEEFNDNWNNVADEKTNKQIIDAMKKLFADEIEVAA